MRTAPDGGLMREQVLDQVPSLGSLYARALGRTARAAAPGMLSGGPSPTTLPQVCYTVPRVPVDHAHLAEYQYLLGEAGTDELPAGYVHVLGFPLAMNLMVRADFPLPVLGMVHVANRVEQFHPLSATDTLRVQARAQGLRAHRSGTQVDLVVEVAAQEGPEVAWRGVSTYLAKGTTLPGLALAEPVKAGQGGSTGSGDAVDDGDSGAAGSGPSRGGAGGNDAGGGGVLPEATAVWRLTPRTGRRYAAVSGDRNPIHMSALSARAFGFPRAIAHGMYTAARALAAVGPSRGPAFTWQIDFAKPVLLPSTVSFGQARTDSGTYTYAGWKAGTDRVHFTGSVRPLP
ncbi:MaoC/PaaZ C-terminal domain-containing protein [Pseudactinotalea sp. Z1739]|uniref:MaoC/PaaZ C-terminal domain-containing protein n=1 Tax=Pseudactinotalea sp. Z1739 TaxID=3413028 RepID=UPI003C7D8E02